jgi:hypothetical protein
MMGSVRGATLVVLACFGASCGRFDFDARVDATGARGDAVDAVDAPAPCTWSAFGPVTALPGPIQSAVDDWSPTPTQGGLTLYFQTFRAGGPGGGDIFYATRPDLASEFSTPVPVSELDTAKFESGPTLTDDALDIMFERNLGGGGDLYEATRTATGAPFTGITALATVNSPADETDPFVSADGLRLVFDSSTASNGYDLYETTRPARASAFAAPTPLTELNTTSDDYNPTVSADGLDIFFSSNRPGGPGGLDIYTAHRPALDQPFGPATLVGELSTSLDDCCVRLSLDGTTMYFNSSTNIVGGSNADLDTATRSCN